jgi:hypothetical protein
MSEFDFKPNSHKFREEQKENVEPEKKVEKVVKGTVKTKKNNVRKVTDVFIAEDVTNVKSYILMDVLVPAIKKALLDVITNGADMILYGGTGKSGKRHTADRISYTRYSDKSRDRDRDYTAARGRNGYDYDDIVLETRGDAERVLSQLNDLIDTYGYASIADMYDLVGEDCPYTHHKYGWTNIRNAEAVRVRDGYMLKMPKALHLD